MLNDSHHTVSYAHNLELNDLTLNYAQAALNVAASWQLGTPQPLTNSNSFPNSAMTPDLLLLSLLTTPAMAPFLR